MSEHSRAERLSLADTFDAVGPDAPTLCTGWSAADLAAHLVMRESDPLAAAGLVVAGLAARSTQTMTRLKEELTYADLVMRFRNGPPAWSPTRLGAVDRVANTVEFFVHHEDVRRAQPEWQPRRIDDAMQEFCWARLRGAGRFLFRKVAVGVLLARPDGELTRVRGGEPTAVLAGRPSELMLYAFGRRDVAKLELSGPEHAIEALRQASLRV